LKRLNQVIQLFQINYNEDIYVKSSSTERKVTIEQHKRFSQSALWRMQRDYFDKEGINAWVNQVPFYITSNPYIAACYAKIVLAFIRDWVKAHPASKNQPFYFMELGTGSGRFSYYFIKTLIELMAAMQLQDIKFCYIMSDFTKHNIKYWETHPALKPYIEKGLIDFALYDMEAERPITLVRKNVHLSPEILVNPLTVFANYIFDTVSHDAFTVHENKLYELLFSLHTDENNMEHNRAVDMEKIGVDYNIHEIKSAYYGDPHLDPILDQYKAALQSTSFLIPIGSIHAIKFLKKLANNQLLILSTDKGYSAVDQLDNLGHPSISFHGSFSMMVNFHAIGEYFKNSGGDAYLQTPRRGIRTSVFASGFKLNEFPETSVAVTDWVERMSPSDYFTLHSRVRDHFSDYDLDTLASHMELTGWDPHIYLKISSKITSLIEESDPETIQFMAKNMPRLAANYYHMPKSECILFEIGVFFHAIKNYAEALHYYQQAQPYVGEQFGLFYNRALCEHHLGQNEAALVSFKQALVLDPESKETAEWITFTEQALAPKDTDT
jgi:tetratricopeptide (TPR) repeat protein